MARAPEGVATGVSGEAQMQSGQPGGQRPAALGAEHCTVATGPAYTSQQSSPAPQQAAPQQVPVHDFAVQGGVVH